MKNIIYYSRPLEKYILRIVHNGEYFYVGRFDTREEAEEGQLNQVEMMDIVTRKKKYVETPKWTPEDWQQKSKESVSHLSKHKYAVKR